MGSLRSVLVTKKTTEDLLLDKVPSSETKWMPREEAEVDESGWRQIIPYVVFFDPKAQCLLCCERLGSEKRLNGLLSCGFGGHIEPIDHLGDPLIPEDLVKNFVRINIRRELREELLLVDTLGARIDPMFFIRATTQPELVICCDDTPVSKVHLGLVYIAEYDENPFTVPPRLASDEGKELKWVWLSSIVRDQELYDAFEPWSQDVIVHLARMSNANHS